MWDRKALKEKGKADFRANRFVCILAAFILVTVGAIGGGGGGASTAATGASSAASGAARNNAYMYNMYDAGNIEFKGVATEDNQDVELNLDDIEGWEDDAYDDFYDDYDVYSDDLGLGASPDPFVVMGVLLVIIAILIPILVLLDAFIFNPVTVGVRKFFVANAKDHNAGLDRNTFGFAFYNGYKNIVGAMFVTDLFVFLLTLLFIIPGVIFGKYVWRMVPYILGENPNMKGSDARALSAQMMSGHKWKTFVLDLSFIGWYLLAIVTLGISDLVWTNPYHAQTDAELYLALTDRSDAAVPSQGGYYADPQQGGFSAPEQDRVVFGAEDDVYAESDVEIDYASAEPAAQMPEADAFAAVTEPAVPEAAEVSVAETASPAVEPAAPEAAAEVIEAAETVAADVADTQPEDAYAEAADEGNVEDNYNY